MIIDIHYKVQYFDSRKDERVCFMCAVRITSVLNPDEGRVKLKSGCEPFKCDHCDMFIHDTIDTGEDYEKEVTMFERKHKKPTCKCGCMSVNYSERYDACYCPICNEWIEPKCVDPECVFCTTRPSKPLPF